MKHILLFIIIALLIVSCTKVSENKISNVKWSFEVKPEVLISNYNGTQENRTQFSGSEIIELRENGDFYINEKKYGTWVLEENSIIINQLAYQEYNCCGGIGSETIMVWNIVEIKSKHLTVNHPFYKFDQNTYDFIQN